MSKPNSTPLTAERLRELIHYDADTGVFTRRVKLCNRVHVGDVAGSIMKNGYWRLRVDVNQYRLHRLAWLYVYGTWPTKFIDHIDGDPSNNRITNLREATNAENMQNVRRAQIKNKSTGLLGVTFDKSRGKFSANITINGKTRKLGRYSTAQEAHQAYLTAKRELHPFSTL